MTTHCIHITRFFLYIILSLLPVLSTYSQATPEAGDRHAMTFAMTIDMMPVPEAEVWFFRAELEPGTQVSPERLRGPVILIAESGSITLSADKELIRVHDTDSATPEATDDIMTLGAGEGVLVNPDTTLGITNGDERAATLLVLSFLDPEHKEGNMATPETRPEGVRIQPIAMGRLPLDNERGIVLIERDVVRPNGSDVSSTYRGIELGAVERGRAEVTFHRGMSWLRPNVLAQAADMAPAGPVQIVPGARVALTAGDGYTSVDSSLVWRAGDDEPLVVVRAQVIPIPLPT